MGCQTLRRTCAEDSEGKVRDNAFLIFMSGFGPDGGDTYYQLGVNVFLQVKETCKGPQGMVVEPPSPPSTR